MSERICLLNAIERRRIKEIVENINKNTYENYEFGFVFAMLKKYVDDMTTFQIKQAFELGQLIITTCLDERSSSEIVELIEACFYKTDK